MDQLGTGKACGQRLGLKAFSSQSGALRGERRETTTTHSCARARSHTDILSVPLSPSLLSLSLFLRRDTQTQTTFLETMDKISGKGKPMSPRSPRLLGGLKGQSYRRLK